MTHRHHTRDDRHDEDSARSPSAGHAAQPSSEGAIGLGGAQGAVAEGGVAGIPHRPDPREVPATGIETGNATLGSSTNAAVTPDELDTPRR